MLPSMGKREIKDATDAEFLPLTLLLKTLIVRFVQICENDMSAPQVPVHCFRVPLRVVRCTK